MSEEDISILDATQPMEDDDSDATHVSEDEYEFYISRQVPGKNSH